MTNVSLKNLICGFIAGAIAVMTVHEVVNFLLLELGLFPRIPWSMEPAVCGDSSTMRVLPYQRALWGHGFDRLHR